VRKTLAIIVVLLASLPLAAAEGPTVHRGTPRRQGRFWVEQDQCFVPVKPGGRLVVRADMGSLTVLPTAADQTMQCQLRLISFANSEPEARAAFVRSELSARRLGSDGAYVEFRFPQDRPMRRLDVSFCILVPSHFNLDLETQSGTIQVDNLDGELRAATSGGDIHTADITGATRVQTAAGDIDLGNISQRLDAHTAAGSIRVGDVKGDANLETSGGEIVSGLIGGNAHAQTAAGDILLRGVQGQVVAHTAGGQIQLGECGGTVRADTAAGSIHVDGARGRVDAQTAGGSLELLRLMSGVRAGTAAGQIMAQIDASRQTFSSSSLESSVGDLMVYLPSDLPLTVKALIDNAAGHKIASDFPLTERRQAGDYGAGPEQASAALAGGGAQLNLHTTLGDIEIRKLDPMSVARLKAYQQSFWRNWQEQTQEQQRALDQLQKVMQMQMQALQQEFKAMSEGSQP
jgi:hypothetical protein